MAHINDVMRVITNAGCSARTERIVADYAEWIKITAVHDDADLTDVEADIDGTIDAAEFSAFVANLADPRTFASADVSMPPREDA